MHNENPWKGHKLEVKKLTIHDNSLADSIRPFVAIHGEAVN